jgi:hypothetical protein
MPTEPTIHAEHLGEMVVTATDGTHAFTLVDDAEDQVLHAGHGACGRGAQGVVPAHPGVTCRAAS